MDTSKQTKAKRTPGLDVVRTFAVLCVLTTHAIAYLGPMNTGIHSLKWSVYLFIRFTALTGVPLFLLLTGYLNCRKTLTPRYFRGILPVLLSYVVISAASAVAADLTGAADFTPFAAVLGILNFTANGYAWYVEMYVGLFLFIPFLNLLYQALSPRARLLFGDILLGLTALPAVFESFRVSGTALDIVPDYWESVYPVFYFWVGALLRDCPPRIGRLKRLLAAAGASLIPVTLCWFASNPADGYAWYMMNGFSCLTTALTAVCIFLLFYDLPLPAVPAAVFAEFSVCAFETYLFSYIVDIILYPRIRFFMPAMVLVSFLASYVLARILRLILHPAFVLLKDGVRRGTDRTNP